MIPHRMLCSEIRSSGLKERVTACRKRLRENRVTHHDNALNGADELFRETAPALTEFRSYTSDFPGTPTSLVRTKYQPVYEVPGLEDEADLFAGEQEVGIT